MSDCCASSRGDSPHPEKHHCPRNGQAYSEVSVRTIRHHIKDAWTWHATSHRYFYCDDPACEVAYFGDDDSIILKSQLRTSAGIKESSDHRLLCHCFGVTAADFFANPATRDFVIDQTKSGLCSCEVSNPSGRCCLKDFLKRTN